MELERFALLDEIVAIDSLKGEIVGRAIVPVESSILAGHFPGFSVLPGVLLAELMGQLCCQLVMEIDGFRRLSVLAKIANARFLQFVRPADTLLIRAKLEYLGDEYAVCTSVVERSGDVVAESELRFKLVAFPNESVFSSSQSQRERLAAKHDG